MRLKYYIVSPYCCKDCSYLHGFAGKAMWPWPAFSKRNALMLPKTQILCFPEIVSNDAGQSAA